MIRLHNSLSVILLVACFALISSAGHAALSAKQILDRAAKPFDAINDYTVNAKLTAKSSTMDVPGMEMTIYYKKPDKLHIEGKDGFAVLPKHGLVLGNPVRDFVDGSDLALEGKAKVLGKECYVVRATYKQNDRAVDSRVWIDTKSFLPVQLASNPEWGPSMKVKLSYTKVKGRYWLPSSTTAQVSMPPIQGIHRHGPPPKPGEPTTVTIKFSNYRVNTGLSDNIFRDSSRSNSLSSGGEG